MTGIEGSLTLFGDLYIRTAQQVELIDRRYPGKNGVYLVDIDKPDYSPIQALMSQTVGF